MECSRMDFSKTWPNLKKKALPSTESSQYDNHGSEPSTEERRKLLKRTRSLAVISEDESRCNREIPHFRIGEPNFDLGRRPQLIPRAKLIDRNSLKDRLSKSQQHLSDSYDKFNEAKSYHSRPNCAVYSPPGLTSLPDPLSCNYRASRPDPDRLNILDWPESPKRYCSVQNLDTVSSLVEIVEDNWPIEGNRSLDCIYTQIKRKRKEHRSLDSILFEDEGELEYFDVLKLLPLSNVRLEIEEADARNNNLIRERDKDEFYDGTLNNSDKGSNKEFPSSTGSNETDEEKSRSQEDEGRDSRKEFWNELVKPSRQERKEFWERIESQEGRREERRERIQEQRSLEGLKLNQESRGNQDLKLSDAETKAESRPGDQKQSLELKFVQKIKPFQDIKSTQNLKSFRELKAALPLKGPAELEGSEKLRISEELKQVKDLNVSQVVKPPLEAKISKETKRFSDWKSTQCLRPFLDQEGKPFPELRSFPRPVEGRNLQNSADKYRANVAIVTPCEEKVRVEEVDDVSSIWISDEEPEEMSRRPQVLKIVDNDLTKRCNKSYDTIKRNELPKGGDKVLADNGKRGSIENVRSFFEIKSSEKDVPKTPQVEGRFERIVKETSNILGKACNVVKGTLGFEARSESSDLGLGSEAGNDTRQPSVVDERSKAPLENGIAKDKRIPEIKVTECQEPKITNCSKDDASEKRKNHSNLTRSRSCVDSIECQDEPEFDHVRYKIVKSNLFGKRIFSTSKGDVTYEGLMEYLREYSFQELLLDNNVVIIEPVRAEVERKTSMSTKSKSLPTCRVSGAVQKKMEADPDKEAFDEETRTCPRQSSLRKHFFYHPIRVNKELIDDELPDPDTVRNVRRMFEESLKDKMNLGHEQAMRSLSLKDLNLKDEQVKGEEEQYNDGFEKNQEARSRSSSRAKDLTKHFENLEKTNSLASIGSKDESECPRSESKTRILAQCFEARSGHTSPSDSNSSNKNRVNRFNQHNRHHNWDAGSVSSGVSSDYPDTDPGSAPPCTSSEDEEIDCQDEDGEEERGTGHYVSQDVLKKIRECGTSVTYYGGKVVNTCNGPLIVPMNNKLSRRNNRLQDYVKFRLVKSNSCDSRLELTGRVIEERNIGNWEKNSDLRQCTIAEMPSIEISSLELQDQDHKEKMEESKREPPIVIGLEPKKEESKTFKADFKLGKLEDSNPRGFSAFSRWQINENGWRKNTDFGKMEFEEFEVLEDSLNGADNQI